MLGCIYSTPRCWKELRLVEVPFQRKALLILYYFGYYNYFVLSSLQLRPTSIEKEIFPKMAQDDNLFAFDLSGEQ